MNRTLRGAWAHRGSLLPLLLLTAVVVSGVVAVTALAGGSGTSSAAVVPLLALGLVAVPESGRQLAAIRRHEIAVARLHGATGGQLAVTLAVEPFLVLVPGSVLGLMLGAVVAGVAAAFGLGEVSFGVTVLPVVALVVGFGLVAVIGGMAGALREPLAEQVSVEERPRPASTLALFGRVLLLAAAVVATYRSSVVDAQDPGWVVLAAPALVGLALGQVTVWVLRLFATAGVRWTAGAKLPAFLALRRLARNGEAASPIRLVVGASVVVGVALTGAQQIGTWSEETARLRAGAPYQILLEDADVKDALALTRKLDPDGTWLMAAAVVPGEGSVPARRGFVDTSRYTAVVGQFLAGTPAEGASRHLDALGAEAPFVGTGDTVSATARGVSRRLSGRLRPRITLTYRNAEGSSTVRLRLRIGLDGKATTTDRVVPDCRLGCVATGLSLDRTPGDANLPWVLTGLNLGGLDALNRDWRPVPQQLPAGVVADEVVAVNDGLLAPPSNGPLEVFSSGGGPAVPVLATESAQWDGPPLLDSPGGEERRAEVVSRLPALPLVEADGVLADLPTAAEGAPPTVPAAEVMVLAAADTPRDVLDAVAETPGAELRSLTGIRDATDLEAGADRANAYAMMAGFCVVVAMLVTASTIARQRAAYRREVAALRVLGVGFAESRRSRRWELVALGLGAVVGSVLGGIAGVVLLLGNLALVDVPAHSIPLELGVALLPLAVSALAAGAIVVLVVGRGRSARLELTRPSLLREEA